MKHQSAQFVLKDLIYKGAKNMKLNPLITESMSFSVGLESKELEALISKLSLNVLIDSVHVALHHKNEAGELTYVVLFYNSVFYVIRFPNALKDPTGYTSRLKNNTFDVFCFSYNSVTEMTVVAPNPKQFINPCLFIKLTGSEELSFAVSNRTEVLYRILNLYHTYSDNKK